MAELITLARPYAKAAFETALQDDALDKWSNMIALSAQAFIGVCGDELDEKGKNFISLLAENKRLVLLWEISSLFETLKANQEMSVDVEITTAFEISSDVSNKLAQALKDRLKREIILATSVDQSLIGGAIIRAGDNVIDSSVRGKLSKLAESMNS